jgi:hypothetical protein
MRTKLNRKGRVSLPIFAAGIALAMAFTINACGSDDDSDGSNGGVIPFNENSQIYNEDGSVYKGSGVIEMNIGSYRSGLNGFYEWNGLIVGSVIDGIVKLEFPENINGKEDFLEDFFDYYGNNFKSSCTDYPKDIKSLERGHFVLTNSNRDYIGDLLIRYRYYDAWFDESEEINYDYYSKAGKIACNKNYTGEYGNEHTLINIDAKVGWNKIYSHVIKTENSATGEWSTNNILTREMKWVLYVDKFQ